MIVIRMSLLFLFCVSTLVLQGQSYELAREYLKQGDLTKAEYEFDDIVRKKNNLEIIYPDYLHLLIKLKKYEKAQKFVSTQIKSNPTKIIYYVDLEIIQLLMNNLVEANLTRRKYIQLASQNDQMVYEIQNKYYVEGKFSELVDFLKEVQGGQTIPHKFGIQLARAYLFNGQKDKMLFELLNWGVVNGNVDYIRNNILDNFKTESELSLVEKTLFDYIQKKPNETFFNEMLVWFYTTQKDFKKAFRFSKALDKRLKLNGQNVLDLGLLAFNNENYSDAQDIFLYLTSEYFNSSIFQIATYWLIQSKEKIIKNTFPIKYEDLISLKNEYESLRSTILQGAVSYDITRNLALLEAFYLDNKNSAIQLLTDLISNSEISPLLKDQCKIDLADIYLLNDEPWESSLLYMQVEKSQKESPLAESAKLKNAKLYYFQSEFDLAKEILDILKKATTREIANDALKLALHIEENKGDDSASFHLQSYSKAELLLFQNKYQEADQILDSLFSISKDLPIADDILWTRYEIALKLGKFQEAILFLDEISTNYGYETLADDALYQAAMIEMKYLKNPVRAMELYEKIIFTYPGSVYTVDARKKIRELRGDNIE